MTPARRFTLADAMLLVAATAAGMAMARVLSPSSRPRGAAPALDWYVLFGMLICWTVALLAVRLRRPRPRLRRLALQPGLIATATAATALALLGPLVGMANHAASRSNPGSDLLVILVIPQVGFAVGGAWLALTLSGRRRPEPGWIDGLGRLVGAAWLAATGILWGIAILR